MRQHPFRPSLLRVALAALLLGPCLAAAATIPLEVAGENDEQRYVRLTGALEADPLADNQREVRAWLTSWAATTPDITANICNTLGPGFDDLAVGDNGAYFVQLLFGNVAFQIAHPDQRDDETAVQVAAVESVLRFYAATRAARPETSVPALDTLQAQQAAGTLAADLAPVIAANCTHPASP